MSSVRAALALKAKGLTDVWVLKGGLNAWIRAGYPTQPADEVKLAGGRGQGEGRG